MTRVPHRATILVADDDAVIRANLALLLRSEGYTVREAADGVEAARALQDPAVALALLDLRMPGQDGMAVLRADADRLDETPVIVVTAYGGGSAAIEAMKLGAYDYITKPFDLDDVLFAVRRALTQRVLAAQVMALSGGPAGEADDEELVGRGPAMMQVFKTIGRVAATREPVLITGESGTGKELAANAIHRNSGRANQPFVKVNSAALSPTLLESELFGHEKGAFTGAVAQRKGRFEQAAGGTLFLDEIGELDVDLQAKLLRVLQMGRFERVGGAESLESDVPRDRGDQPRPAGADRRGPVPRGPVLSAQCGVAGDAAAAPEAGGHPASGGANRPPAGGEIRLAASLTGSRGDPASRQSAVAR